MFLSEIFSYKIMQVRKHKQGFCNLGETINLIPIKNISVETEKYVLFKKCFNNIKNLNIFYT